jgi:alpha-tubulin suppressor-like RCC1 family protein
LNSYGETNVPPDLTNVVAVAGGDYHSVALKADGRVVAWGWNFYDQTNVPAGLSNVVAIACGSYHNLALKTDGTVVAWGAGTDKYFPGHDYGQASVPEWATNVIQVAANGDYSLALRRDGTLVGWGWQYAPLYWDGISNIVAVAAGGSHVLADARPLELDLISASRQNRLLRFYAFADQNYSVEYSSDLNPNGWITLPHGIVKGTGAEVTVADTTTNELSREFFRIKLLP